MTMDKTSDWDLAPHDDPEFVAAWCKMEDEGYIYSESNVAKVHLGWLMARKYAALEVTGVVELRKQLEATRAWIASLTVTDMNEIVADGGITAGMVVGQEAIEQVRRIDNALTQLAKGSE